MLVVLLVWWVDTVDQLTLILIWVLRYLIDKRLAHAFWVAVPMIVEDIVPAAETDDSKATGTHDLMILMINFLGNKYWKKKKHNRAVM